MGTPATFKIVVLSSLTAALPSLQETRVTDHSQQVQPFTGLFARLLCLLIYVTSSEHFTTLLAKGKVIDLPG